MHHTKLFDHVILINRDSTDRSVEICRQFAPNWEVRDSKVPEFDAILVDQEVMDAEKEVNGWKMTLYKCIPSIVRGKLIFLVFI